MSPSLLVCFFFFKQKTAYEMRIRDWSSDVCSSDLIVGSLAGQLVPLAEPGQTVADQQRRHAPVAELLHEIGRADVAGHGHADDRYALGVILGQQRRELGLVERDDVIGQPVEADLLQDRKSTRLNSSH